MPMRKPGPCFSKLALLTKTRLSLFNTFSIYQNRCKTIRYGFSNKDHIFFFLIRENLHLRAKSNEQVSLGVFLLISDI